MTTKSQRPGASAYLTRDEGEIPVRTREWPRLVKLLGAWPVIERALCLQAAEGLSLEAAAQRAGVHVDTVRGWQRATATSRRVDDK